MLKWVFGADTGPFRRSLQQMRNETKQFSSGIKGMVAGALGLSAITAAFRGLFVEMDRVQKLGLRFGETAETIQKISLASKLAGADIEAVAKGLTVATRNAYEAATGNKEYAESFERLGINAESFVNLPMEEKLTVLAGAYDQVKGSGEGLALMMEVLGRSGGELIPLLTQGMEGLEEQFANTHTASQQTVDSIARFNDEMTKLKQTAQVVGGAIVDGFRLVFGTIGAGLGILLGAWTTSFEVIKESVINVSTAVNKLATGDFAGAADAAKRIGRSATDAFGQMKNNVEGAGESIKELFDEMYTVKPGSGAPGPDVEDAIAAAEEAKKLEEERAKLAAEVAKLEEDARERALSLTERILEAERERAELAAQAAAADDPTAALEARKQMLEVEKELETLRTKQAGEQKKAAGEKQKKEKELADLLTREKEVERDNRFAGLSDEDKLAALKKEREVFRLDAKTKSAAGDQKGAAESRIRAKELTGQIDELTRSLIDNAKSELDSLAREGPVIATSSLAEIGGGGNAAIFGQEVLEQRKIDLLTQIAENTGAGENGPNAPVEPAA